MALNYLLDWKMPSSTPTPAVEPTGDSSSDPAPSHPLNNEEALEQVLTLLRAKDDTKRFAGLAFLSTLINNLDTPDKVAEFRAVSQQCWEAIPASFLDRLFNAQPKASAGDPDARSYYGIAVGVFHFFLLMLDGPSIGENSIWPAKMSASLQRSWTGRVRTMFAALDDDFGGLHTPIMQILYQFSRHYDGACILVSIEDWSSLFNQFTQHESVPDIFVGTYKTLTYQASSPQSVDYTFITASLNRQVSTAFRVLEDSRKPELLWLAVNGVLDDLAQILSSEASRLRSKPPWLDGAAKQLLQSPYNKRKDVNPRVFRMHALALASTLITQYPQHFPSVMFYSLAQSEATSDAKPPTYVFVKMVIVEIRATLLVLPEVPVRTPEFVSKALQASQCYIILCGFISYLVSDDTPSLLSPDLLLRLRKDIAELLSETISYFREAFEGATDQKSIEAEKDESQSVQRQDVTTILRNSPLILAQIQTLGLWLREDDGEALKVEAASMMENLLDMLKQETSHSNHDAIVVALEGICMVPEGAKAFMERSGWQTLVAMLKPQITAKDLTSAQEYTAMQILNVFDTVISSYQERGMPVSTEQLKLLNTLALVDASTIEASGLKLSLFILARLLFECIRPEAWTRYRRVAERIVSKAKALYELGGPVKSQYLDVMMELTGVMEVD
ncbi:hypothetical protein MMC25_004249 [Agyrium rufum]|nr:hypothetical protein [Agyrium rufum]